LPKLEMGAYAQMPYEAISKEEFDEKSAKVKPIEYVEMSTDAEAEKFCTTDKCEIRTETQSLKSE